MVRIFAFYLYFWNLFRLVVLVVLAVPSRCKNNKRLCKGMKNNINLCNLFGMSEIFFEF